jgi:hypothetical protein
MFCFTNIRHYSTCTLRKACFLQLFSAGTVKINQLKINYKIFKVNLVNEVQNRAEAADVPNIHAGVGEGAAEVGPVQRSDEGDVLPELSLQILVVRVRRRLVPTRNNNLTNE